MASMQASQMPFVAFSSPKQVFPPSLRHCSTRLTGLTRHTTGSYSRNRDCVRMEQHVNHPRRSTRSTSRPHSARHRSFETKLQTVSVPFLRCLIAECLTFSQLATRTRQISTQSYSIWSQNVNAIRPPKRAKLTLPKSGTAQKVRPCFTGSLPQCVAWSLTLRASLVIATRL